jgi:hypothetical protein
MTRGSHSSPKKFKKKKNYMEPSKVGYGLAPPTCLKKKEIMKQRVYMDQGEPRSPTTKCCCAAACNPNMFKYIYMKQKFIWTRGSLH